MSHSHSPQPDEGPLEPAELSRRSFMANAVVTIGGVIGLSLAIPLLGSLVPSNSGAGGTWTALGADELSQLEHASETPVRLSLTVKSQDGYLPPSEDQQFVWGIRVPEAKRAAFVASRPDLFVDAAGKVDFPVVNMGFVIFSSVCPHLGCKFQYNSDAKRFICPCHGSQFEGATGAHVAGPAPRGLDPLPFRERSGQAEITWIDYRSSEPSRVIVAYT